LKKKNGDAVSLREKNEGGPADPPFGGGEEKRGKRREVDLSPPRKKGKVPYYT